MKREPALSEVIGFLLIVSLLAILFSMYLLYVVPLQGRDAEIAHMNEVKGQFAAIKMSVDSLILNQEVNYPFQYEISLGTGQGSSSGAFSIMPMQSFAGSSGELRVDTREGPTGYLDIRLAGIYGKKIAGSAPSGDPGVTYEYDKSISDVTSSGSDIFVDPQHFYIYYMVPDELDKSEVLSIDADNWSVTTQVIPRYDKTYVNVTNPASIPYDLTVTIRKGGNTTMENLTVAESVNSANNPYTVNLYDWAYGLADSLEKTYTFKTINSTTTSQDYNISQLWYSQVQTTYEIPTSFDVDEKDLYHPLQMLEYRSQNRYWVDQNYQYQWGAIFINQTEGFSIPALPPISIEIEETDPTQTIQLKITDTNLTTHQEGIELESISGSQSNPVQVKLINISPYINEFELYDNETNAKYVIISARSDEQRVRDKWSAIFHTIVNNAKVSPGSKISDHNVVVKDIEFESAPDGVGLITAWDGTGTINLTEKLESVTKISEIIPILDANYPGTHLKVSYTKADVECSLYNIIKTS